MKINLSTHKGALLAAVFALCFFSGNLFAQNAQNQKRILMGTSELINPQKDSSDTYLAVSIKNAVINDIQNYSDVRVINYDDKGLIRKLQFDSQKIEYSEEDNEIEVGKLINAKLLVQIKITRNSQYDTYSASSTITDLITGEILAGTQTEFYNQSVFLNRAHGEISIGILSSKPIGKTFSDAERRLIINGNGIAADSTAAQAKEDIEKIEQELEKVRVQLLKADTSMLTDAQLVAERKRQEQQEAILVQKQKQAKEKLARLEEEAKRHEEEEKANKNRNEQQRQSIAKATEKIISQIQKKQEMMVSEMNAFQKITVIENEKQTLSQMYQEIKNNIDSFDVQMDQEMAIAMDKVEDEATPSNPVYKLLYDSNGRLNEQGKALLKQEKIDTEKKYEDLKLKNKTEILEKSEKSLEALRLKISNDIDTLKKESQISSSLTDEEVYFSVGDFDTALNGWNYKLIFSLGGEKVYETKGTVSYSELTGNKIANLEKDGVAAYKKYISDAQLYDSYFRLGISYLSAEVKYKVTAAKYENASQYVINIDSIQFINQDTKKVCKTIPLKSQTAIFHYTPATSVDWRNNFLKQADQKEQQQKEIQLEKQKKEEETAAERRKMQLKAAQEKREKELAEAAEKRRKEIAQAEENRRREELKLYEEKQKREEKEARRAEWNAMQKPRNTLTGLYFLPTAMNFVIDDWGEVTGTIGYDCNIAVSKHFFIGGYGGIGLSWDDFTILVEEIANSSGLYSNYDYYDYYYGSSSSSSSEETTTDCYWLAMGRAGFNWNFTEKWRNSVFVELGYALNNFAVDFGYNFEIMGEMIEINAGVAFGILPGATDKYEPEKNYTTYTMISFGVGYCF